MKEIIKDIKGYEGLYQVSSLGYIISLPRKRCKGGILKGSKGGTNTKSLKRVYLSKKGKAKRFWIHKLVESHFKVVESNLVFIDRT